MRRVSTTILLSALTFAGTPAARSVAKRYVIGSAGAVGDGQTLVHLAHGWRRVESARAESQRGG